MTHRNRNNGHETQRAHEGHDAFDQMLVEANQSISAPRGLEKNVSRAIGRLIAIRRVAGVGSIATIVLVASVLVQSLSGPASQVQPGSQQARTNDGLIPSPDDITPSAPIVHRTAIVYSKPDSKFFARAIHTSKPNVTFVRLYRDLTPTHAIEPASDDAGEDARDENAENIDQNTDPNANQSIDQIDKPGAAGPGREYNETIIRSEA